MPPLSKRAAALLEQFPGPVTLHQTKTIWLVPLALPVTGTILLAWLIWPHRFGLTTKALLLLVLGLTVLWAPSVVGLAFRIAKGLPRLVLDAEGFGIRHVFGFSRTYWTEIAGFTPIPLMVLLRYAAPAPGLWKRLNRAQIVHTYFGLGAADLAQLLTAWRERALAQQAGDGSPYGSSSVSQ